MNKQIIHDALILAAFTLVLGFILALVHDITLKPIEAANLATAQAAYKEVFKDADGFKAMIMMRMRQTRSLPMPDTAIQLMMCSRRLIQMETFLVM